VKLDDLVPRSMNHRFERIASPVFGCLVALLVAGLGTEGCKKKAPRDPDALPIDQAHPPDRVPGASPVATLERTGCYGECPVYRLTVNSDGTVVYVGTRWVKALGRQQYKISEAQLAELDAAFDRVNFMQLRDFDRVENTDEDWAHVSLTRAGRTKRVRHYHGDVTAPPALSVLEDEFDRIVDSGRLIGLPNAARATPPAVSAPATSAAPLLSAAAAGSAAPGQAPDAGHAPPSGKPADSAKAPERAGPPDENLGAPENQ